MQKVSVLQHLIVGEVSFDNATTRDQAHTLLNGKIGLLWWAIVGDDFHVTLSNFATIPFPIEKVATHGDKLGEALRAALEAAMQANLVFKLNAGKQIGNYNLAKCRDISDKSDLIWKGRALSPGCLGATLISRMFNL